jgi:hypothetical protein
LPELEHEAAREAEVEITDLDSHTKGSQTVNRCVHAPRLLCWTRLWMTLLTMLGVALFSWLLVSSLPLTGASHLEQASTGHIFTPSNHAPSRSVQMVVVQKVIYVLDQDGLVRALWTRHKYVYLLWQCSVAPSSQLLRVDHNVVYLASSDGRRVALRASDGAVLWTKRRT